MQVLMVLLALEKAGMGCWAACSRASPGAPVYQEIDNDFDA